MQYYIFEGSCEVTAQAIRSPDGRFLGRYGEFAKYWEVDHGIASVPFLDTEADIESSDDLPDIIDVYLETMVSSRVQSLLTQFDCDPTICFLPARIINRAEVELSSAYVMPFSRFWHNAIAPTASNAELADSGAIIKIRRWVFDRTRIPLFDLWYAHRLHWVVSERLANALYDAQVTNMLLKEISVE